MSIASTTNRNSYTGNDTTETYSYSYRIFSEDDLKLIVKDTSDNSETVLTKTTDYTVTGVGASSGTIVLVDASQAWISASSYLDTGFELTVRRVLDLTQETDIRNQGDFYPEAHENEFDRSRMIDQQQQDEIDRGLKVSESVDPSTFDATIPTPEADKFIKINAGATGWEYSDVTIANINNSNIASDADIARTKVASGTVDHVVINDGSGVLSSEATLAKSRGGSGADNSNLTFPTTGTIATTDQSETFTNKTITAPDIDGSTASNASRLTLPKASKATLDALTRKEATIVYDTDSGALFSDNGSSLIELGTGGSLAFISRKKRLTSTENGGGLAQTPSGMTFDADDNTDSSIFTTIGTSGVTLVGGYRYKIRGLLTGYRVDHFHAYIQTSSPVSVTYLSTKAGTAFSDATTGGNSVVETETYIDIASGGSVNVYLYGLAETANATDGGGIANPHNGSPWFVSGYSCRELYIEVIKPIA